MKVGERFRLAYVHHTEGGGEVRGYVVCSGRAYLRAPCYSGAWPEMDACVAAALEVEVPPYEITGGGQVSFEVGS